MSTKKDIFNRISLLLGDDSMATIAQKRVIIFGLGGVGGWCAESLVRSGVEHLVLVDSDTVNETNVNRQVMATTKTVGEVKVDALKRRLLEINPDAEIVALQKLYEESTNDSFELDTFDYIIDAIDSLESKAQLLVHACKTQAKVFSSMGAALKIDPTRIKVAEFWKVHGCPLARALRDKLKHKKLKLDQKVMCVFSDELLENKGDKAPNDVSPEEFHKVKTNGTVAHAVAIFGFMLAGLVMQDICKDG